MELFKKYREAHKTFNDAKKPLKKELKNTLKSFLKDNPELKAISWTQGTPYFNDGEPCTFGVHEISVSFEGLNEKDFEEDEDKANALLLERLGGNEGYDEENSIDDNGALYLFNSYSLGETKLSKLVSKLNAELVFAGDLLEEAFGDGVRVTITKDKAVVQEYYMD